MTHARRALKTLHDGQTATEVTAVSAYFITEHTISI